MMRLIAAYRWELWLLVGVACIRLAGAPLVETFLDAYSGPPADEDDAARRLAAARAAASVAAFAAAALSYVRVRRQERELLSLVWTYVLLIYAARQIAKDAAAPQETGRVAPRLSNPPAPRHSRVGGIPHATPAPCANAPLIPYDGSCRAGDGGGKRTRRARGSAPFCPIPAPYSLISAQNSPIGALKRIPR